jgi:hypothetical protein
MTAPVDAQQLLAETMEVIKNAYETARQLEGTELAAELMTARENLMSLREAFADLDAAKQKLRARVETLEASLVAKPDLVRHKGVYWVRGDAEPWCPQCWEKDHVALHLNRTDLLAGRLCVCSRCNYNVNLDHTYPPREWEE